MKTIISTWFRTIKIRSKVISWNSRTTINENLLKNLFHGTLYLWIFLSLLKPFSDPDVWWHLASGRYIVLNRIIPHVDVFSLCCRGTAWINTYWLFDVLLYSLKLLTGFAGLVFTHAFVVLLIFLIHEKRLRLGKSAWFGCIVTTLILFFAGGPQGALYDHYASQVNLLLISIFAYFLDRWRRQGWDRWIWVWPPLFMLWANLHRGFLLGLIIGSCYALADPAAQLKDRLRRLGWLSLCWLGTILNPFTFRIYQMMWDDFFLSGQYITGWDPPRWHSMQIYWATILLLWGTFLFHYIYKKVIKWDMIFVFAFLSYLSLRHVFGVAPFIVFAIPFLVSSWQEVYGFEKPLIKMSGIFKSLTLAAGIAFFGLLSTRIHIRESVDKSAIPVGAFDFIEMNVNHGPFYNDYIFGGYWLWRFGENRPVFIDGRYPAVRGYIPLLDEINRAKFRKPSDWISFMDRYDIQASLMKYLPGSPFPSLYEVYFPQNLWALVYWDDAGLLYLRRKPAFKSLFEQFEFREVLPDATADYFIQKVNGYNSSQRTILRHELERNLAIHPQSNRTIRLLQLFYYSIDKKP